MAESVSFVVDGASLIAGLSVAGSAIGGALLGSVKLLLNYQRGKDAAIERLVNRVFALSTQWLLEGKETVRAISAVKEQLATMSCSKRREEEEA